MSGRSAAATEHGAGSSGDPRGFQPLACAALVLSFVATTKIGQADTFQHHRIVELLARLAFVAVWVPVACTLARERELLLRPLLRAPWNRALLALAAWIMLGAAVHMREMTWLSHGSTVLGLLTAGVAMPLGIFAAHRAGDPEPARFLRWACELAAVHVVVLFAVACTAPGAPPGFEDRVHAFGLSRFTGAFRLSTTNALFLLPFFLLAQERLTRRAGRTRRNVVVAAILGVALLATFSRSAVGIAVASTVVACIRSSVHAGRRRRAALGAVAMAALLLVLAAAWEPSREQLLRATRLDAGGSDYVLNGRIVIWSGAWKHVLANPWFGTGDWIVPLPHEPHDPHNWLLGVAYTHGLPAVALVAVPLVLYLHRRRRFGWLVLWLLVEYSLHGGFLLHLGTPWIVMTILMGWELLGDSDDCPPTADRVSVG